MAEPGLLTLTMIVKNEAASLARTLASAKPHVDRWCILDTGSTDGTQDVIRGAMKDVPGELHEGSFVDFATTRNRGLELCGAKTEFILWMDADDLLEGGQAMRSFLAREREKPRQERSAYYLRVRTPGAAFDSARVLDSESGWRFEGAVHEALTHPDHPPPTTRIEGAAIVHCVNAESEARSRVRWSRDLELLTRELAAKPQATRAAFYLGMTLLWLERYDEAVGALDRRIAMGGWSEEVFYATLSRARAAQAAGRPWEEVLPGYLRAHSIAPHRAEPLHDIAMHYDKEGDHALALLFARRAYELKLPTRDTLFVEESVYTWRAADLVGSHAYWVGELTLGEEAARRAAQARPDDARLARNVVHYESKRR